MDPSIFLHYTAPNGLPQESKLATYMKHTPTSTSMRPLTQALSRISLEDPNANSRVQVPVQINEYVFLNPVTAETSDNASPSRPAPTTPHPQVHQENVGGTTYFVYSTGSEGLNSSHNTSGGLGADANLLGPSTSAAVPNPYASAMYRTPPPMGLTDKSGQDKSCYVYQRNEGVFMQPDMMQFPENVEMYSELMPLEGSAPHSMATSFRVTHRQSCDYYALRRLHAFSNVSPTTRRLETWKHIDHPNVVRLHDYFTTTAFGDHSMILVYDYHATAVTLMNKYLSGAGSAVADGNSAYHDPFSSDPDAPRPYTHQKNAMLRAVASGALLPEHVLWSLLVQLTAALRVIHAAGLACRTLDPTKVLISGCRIRIAWCGVADALHSNLSDVGQAQQDDLTSLGRLTLALACRTIHCDNLPASIELVARTYSADLKNLILYLLSSTSARRSVTDLMPMIGARFYNQVESLERRTDELEQDLVRQYDNGRLLRILIRLGVVNERPELNLDAAWSETGDRYMLKLFRDYLFHAVTPDGRPWLDQAHLVHCLNQLDSGSNAKVELMSRDGQSILVVSYAELKHCLEQAFDEVMLASTPTT
ncbi:PAN2-PAN3 deadenylation complex subunit PAN3 [Hyposmocoma kahamanoa]|uniref:PAN2-PAN3 deadenylation complex subunit PAN3 n=1 Tax=Hyposmocoma kahamanoa TaxID=1477025 RepID=UPI000E6D7470|nr:PAN2-PAN3 deadenylation complex subunit PAN3 [Hyposmocoma kahamanoa]